MLAEDLGTWPAIIKTGEGQQKEGEWSSREITNIQTL